jgi:hypothetical protein
MRLILHNLATLGLCATSYASQEQVILDDTLYQNGVKQVAIIGQFINITLSIATYHSTHQSDSSRRRIRGLLLSIPPHAIR